MIDDNIQTHPPGPNLNNAMEKAKTQITAHMRIIKKPQNKITHACIQRRELSICLARLFWNEGVHMSCLHPNPRKSTRVRTHRRTFDRRGVPRDRYRRGRHGYMSLPPPIQYEALYVWPHQACTFALQNTVGKLLPNIECMAGIEYHSPVNAK